MADITDLNAGVSNVLVTTEDDVEATDNLSTENTKSDDLITFLDEEGENRELLEGGLVDFADNWPSNINFFQDSIYTKQNSPVGGKKIHIIDSANYDDELEGEAILDNLRGKSFKYWSSDDNNFPVFLNTDFISNGVDFSFVFSQQEPSRGNQEPSRTPDLDRRGATAPTPTNNSSYPIREVFRLVPKTKRFSDSLGNFRTIQWAAYLNGGVVGNIEYDPLLELGREFVDHTLVTQEPFTLEEVAAVPNLETTHIKVYDPEYNFYVDSYEKATQKLRTHERLIPNLYALLSQLVLGNEELSGDHRSKLLNTLYGRLDEVLNKTTEGGATFFRDKGQYFELWSKRVDRVMEDERRILNRFFKYIGFSLEDVESESFKKSYDRFQIFPFGKNFKISTDENTRFVEVIKQAKLSNRFVQDFMDIDIADLEYEQDLKPDIMGDKDAGFGAFERFSEALSLDQPYPSKTSAKETVFYPVYDFLGWLDNLGQDEPIVDIVFGDDGEPQPTQKKKGRQSQTKTRVPLGAKDKTVEEAIAEKEETTDVSLSQKVNNYGVLMKLIENDDGSYNNTELVALKASLLTNVQSIIRDELRTFKDVAQGVTCYNETILYKVTKHEALDAGDSLPIQTFYFPNSAELEVLEFIDTQVKYGKKYTYKVKAYQLVVGSRYKYLDPEGGTNKLVPNDDNSVDVIVETTPSVKIIEIPLTNLGSKRVVDSPPMPPDVNFIPYKGNFREVLISLSDGVGERIEEPVVITPTDRKTITYMLESQKDELVDGKVLYNEDDPIMAYDVFRTTTPPDSYQDFSDSLYKIQQTPLLRNATSYVSSAAFKDNVLPNVKYYYMFRARDIHKNISNPSPVYELEMITNSGASYLIWKQYSFPKKENKYMREGRRFVKISLAQPQKEINMFKSGLKPSTAVADLPKHQIILGNQDEGALKKNFKVRITSKNSGKKIDLNFAFDKQISTGDAANASIDEELEQILLDGTETPSDIIASILNVELKKQD